jgi:hypothetical protein
MRLPTTHHRIIDAAYAAATDSLTARTDPAPTQIHELAAVAAGRPLNQHERAVAWQAYLHRYAELAT